MTPKLTQQDGTLALLKLHNIPVTRESYLRLSFAGNPPEELDGEVESEMEEIFREHDAEVLAAMGIGGTLSDDEEETLQTPTPQDGAGRG